MTDEARRALLIGILLIAGGLVVLGSFAGVIPRHDAAEQAEVR